MWCIENVSHQGRIGCVSSSVEVVEMHRELERIRVLHLVEEEEDRTSPKDNVPDHTLKDLRSYLI